MNILICIYQCPFVSVIVAQVPRSKNPGLRCMYILFCDRFLPIMLIFSEVAAIYTLIKSIQNYLLLTIINNIINY